MDTLEIIRLIEEQHDLNHAAFARGLGVSRQVVDRWLHGAAKPNAVLLMELIADHEPGAWQVQFARKDLRARYPKIAKLLRCAGA